MSEVNAVKNEQVKRTHDEFYLQLNRKSTPKEYFKFVDRHVRQFRSLDGLRVVDIGCATGDFLHFLAELYPQAKLYGYDVLDTLLSRARTEVTRATFSRVNISEPDLQSKDQSFDVAFMLGVHSIFDDLHWLNNALSLLRPGGHFYCFGLFNTMDVDVFVKARKSGAKALEPGWNVMSCTTVHAHLASIGQHGDFSPWQITVPVLPTDGDPYRSWTVPQVDGSFEIRNGLQLVHTFQLLHVCKK